MQEIRLEDLENRAYRSVVDDGLLDSLLGLCLVGLGLVGLTDINIPGTDFDVLALSVPLLYPLWLLGRKLLVEPRAGYVRLSSPHRARIKKRRQIVVFSLLVFIVAMFALIHWDVAWVQDLREMKTVLIGIGFGFSVGLAAALLKIKRWLPYAVVIALASVIEYLVGGLFGTALIASGALITISGLTVLLAFLNRHPKRPQEARDDG